MALEILWQQRHLRELGRAGDADELRRLAVRRRGQHLRAPQSLVVAEQAAHVGGHRLLRRGLRSEHVPVELGRPPHRLARVRDDEVEPLARRAQMRAEGLDARRVPQVEPEDLEPVAPLLEVRLGRVARRRVARKARRHDQLRAGAEQLDPGLVADLDAAAREQRDPSAQVGRLRALAEVERRARGAELVVERVDVLVALLADVAMLRLDDLAELRLVDVDLLELARDEHIRRREDGLRPMDADAGLGEHVLVAVGPRRLLFAPHDLVEATPLDDVRVVHVTGGREQPRALLERQPLEQAAVGDDLLEHVRRRLQALGNAVLLGRVHGVRVASATLWEGPSRQSSEGSTAWTPP